MFSTLPYWHKAIFLSSQVLNSSNELELALEEDRVRLVRDNRNAFPDVHAKALDIDNDGDLDLFFGNYIFGIAHLYINDGSGYFEMAPESVINYAVSVSLIAWDFEPADFNNDGNEDIVVTWDIGATRVIINQPYPEKLFVSPDTNFTVYAQDDVSVKEICWTDHQPGRGWVCEECSSGPSCNIIFNLGDTFYPDGTTSLIEIEYYAVDEEENAGFHESKGNIVVDNDPPIIIGKYLEIFDFGCEIGTEVAFTLNTDPPADNDFMPLARAYLVAE